MSGPEGFKTATTTSRGRLIRKLSWKTYLRRNTALELV